MGWITLIGDLHGRTPPDTPYRPRTVRGVVTSWRK